MIRAQCRYTKLSLDKFYRGVNLCSEVTRRELPQNILDERVLRINSNDGRNFRERLIGSFRGGNRLPFKICFLDNFIHTASRSPCYPNFCILTNYHVPRNYSINRIEEAYKCFSSLSLSLWNNSIPKKMSRSFLILFVWNELETILARNFPVTDRRDLETFQHLSSARSSRLTTNYVRVSSFRGPSFPPRVLAPNLTRISRPRPRPARVKTSTAII